MSNELTVNQPKRELATNGVFSSIEAFEGAQRMAGALAKSSLVPKSYQGNVADCILALEIAQRVGVSPFVVVQNLDFIHGRPAWRASFIIASINASGRFSPLEFEMSGEGDDWGCVAVAKRLLDGKELRGPRVSIKMAKAEGWYQKTGSKWQTMPELMLQYRAGSWFGRLHAGDIALGMRTAEEERDVVEVSSEVVEPAAVTASLNEKIKLAKKPAKAKAEEPAAPEVIQGLMESVTPAEYIRSADEINGDDHF